MKRRKSGSGHALRRVLGAPVGALALLALGPCGRPELPFSCLSAAECVFQGKAGLCEATGFCSFPDDDCPGGRRYGALAPGPVAGRCVDARACGDGVVSSGEECDDGNDVNDDGCSNACVRCGPEDGAARMIWADDGSCYVRHDQTLSWTAANDLCAAAGGHLATFTSHPRNDEISVALLGPSPGMAWIGLSDRQVKGMFVWVTGETSSKTRWRSGQPQNRQPGQDCVAMAPSASGASFDWIPRACSERTRFLCQKPPWRVRPFDRHAYRIVFRELTWAQAQQACLDIGARLATITSADEDAFIIGSFHGSYWLDATDADKEGEWRWQTGEAFDYRNWGVGEPDNWDGRQHCLHMGDERRWHDGVCEERRPALCELE